MRIKQSYRLRKEKYDGLKRFFTSEEIDYFMGAIQSEARKNSGKHIINRAKVVRNEK